MKKILLTLFAVAAVFVACDKDTYEDQFETIIPEVEIAEGMSAQDAFDFLNNAVKGIDISNPSSARTDSSSDWLHVIFDENNGVHVAKLNSEDAAETCANGSATSFIYRYNAPVLTIIDAAGAETPFNLSSSLVTRYNAVFSANVDQFVRVNAARNQIASGAVPAISLFDFSCAPAATVYEYGTRIIGGAHDGRVIVPIDPTNIDAASNPSAAAVGTDNIQLQVVRREAGFGVLTWENVGDPFTNPNYVAPVAAVWTAGTGADSNLYSNSDFGSYRVTAAPFPLTGFLATVVSDSTSPANTNNYAGTSEQAVRDAIEANFAE